MNSQHPEFKLEDIVMVPTKCEECGLDGAAPTFKQILAKKDSILVKMLDRQGYADILCKDCATVAVEEYKKNNE